MAKELFADDFVGVSDSKESLQKLIYVCEGSTREFACWPRFAA